MSGQGVEVHSVTSIFLHFVKKLEIVISVAKVRMNNYLSISNIQSNNSRCRRLLP